MRCMIALIKPIGKKMISKIAHKILLAWISLTHAYIHIIMPIVAKIELPINILLTPKLKLTIVYKY